jgi:hypothetical protein
MGCPYMLNFNQELTWMVRAMQNKSKNIQKRNAVSCAGCGKTFGQNEKTVSYDFERFYCFRCDDER